MPILAMVGSIVAVWGLVGVLFVMYGWGCDRSDQKCDPDEAAAILMGTSSWPYHDSEGKTYRVQRRAPPDNGECHRRHYPDEFHDMGYPV